MNHKIKILLLSYGAAGIFTAAGLVFSAAGGAEGVRLSQDYEYRRALAQLVSSVSEMDTALETGTAVTGAGMTGKVSARLMGASQAASTALSILPLETYALEELAEFLSQMEEYARVKGSLACMGVGLDESDRKLWGELQQVTGQLVPVLEQLYTQVSEGALGIRGLIHEKGRVTDPAVTYLEDELLSLLEEFPEPPALVYEGTLSDDYDDSYRALQGLDTVTEQTAKEAADRMAGVTIQALGLSSGELPLYYFTGEDHGRTVTVAITAQGGLPMLYLADHKPGEAEVTEFEAKRRAQEFLERAGYGDLKEAECRREKGLLKLVYVYADSAEHLSEKVRVAVAMDIGRVVSMDASEYLRYHAADVKEASPKLTEDEARDIAVPSELTVTEQTLTWYTGDTGVTTLCWQYTCADEQGNQRVIYADSHTGHQIQVLPVGEDMSEL